MSFVFSNEGNSKDVTNAGYYGLYSKRSALKMDWKWILFFFQFHHLTFCPFVGLLNHYIHVKKKNGFLLLESQEKIDQILVLHS